eukprot:scaffold1183_cov418-Prasinococcus_capsulatus_cf.AAC.40
MKAAARLVGTILVAGRRAADEVRVDNPQLRIGNIIVPTIISRVLLGGVTGAVLVLGVTCYLRRE